MWAKIITIKRTKDLNYFRLCALNLIHEFHNLSWITEINELFHNILIYWDAPVQVYDLLTALTAVVHLLKCPSPSSKKILFYTFQIIRDSMINWNWKEW